MPKGGMGEIIAAIAASAAKAGVTVRTDAPVNKIRVENGRAEFLLLTLWDSEEAVRGFAGDDPGKAVFYPEDERFLVERGERVDHYEVVFQAEGVRT